MTREQYKYLNEKAMTGQISDDLNPAFILSGTNINLLVQIANGEIDMQELAKRVLEGRGLDINGAFAGFNSKIK